ncbi:signal peptidase I [Dermabacteraceae bacterium P7074]
MTTHPETEADAQDGAEEAPQETKQKRSFGRIVAEYALTLFIALIISMLIKTVVQPFYIPSSSMVPTLQVKDQILVSRLSPEYIKLQRGDVVVFEDPDNWLEGVPVSHSFGARLAKLLSYVGPVIDPSNPHLVKRLIGLPGDHVVCRERGAELEVNGVVVHEPYINPDGSACARPFDVVVPADHLWVMGDNRYGSADSSYHYAQDPRGAARHAFVPIGKVSGRAELVMWPISNWRLLNQGREAFVGVPNRG